MELQLKTLTPLWTGGVETGKMDRIHETGIIGSLRWWYEAIVRGLGGRVCDPTTDTSCQFDTKAYEQALKDKKSYEEALSIGLKNVCPVCYLFGSTGWKRLFTLQLTDVHTVPFHLRTSLSINKNWFQRIFSNSDFNVGYGDLTLRLVTRGQDLDFVHCQMALLITITANYGGIGAKQQHGFGQFNIQRLPEELQGFTVKSGLSLLSARVKTKQPTNIPFNLINFVCLEYEIPASKLSAFTNRGSHYGSHQKQNEDAYIPCAFDLRYKGDSSFGFRRWLKEQKGWKESNREDQLGDLDKLMGPRSQWGKYPTRYIKDELRTASRVFFGMPYKEKENVYRLRIFGFVPPELLQPNQFKELVEEYMQAIFAVDASETVLGQEILAIAESAS